MKVILAVILGTYALAIQPISITAEAELPQQAIQAERDAKPTPQAQPNSSKAQDQQPEVPPPSVPPSVQSPEQSVPTPAPTPEQNAPAKPDASTPPSQPEAAAPKASPAPQSEPAKRSVRRKHKKATKQTTGPRKTIVRDGGTSEPTNQLAPGMSQDQAKRSKQSTNQLLSSSQENLKRASGRTLSSGQQATVEQIKLFIEQANAALEVGDFQRGHNLAAKAHALSEDLLKQ